MESDKGLRTFDGAVAIVTGGASGIGRALAEALAQCGTHVVLADLQHDLALHVASDIQSHGGKAAAVELDVTDFSAIDQLVQGTVQTHGRLDYLFNNAGIAIGGEVNLYHIEDWYRVFDVNIRGVVNGVQAAYPVMLHQGYGHLINTASMAGLVPSPGTVSYAAAKHAVVGLSTSLRLEAAAYGVRVSALCPGAIRTPILEDGGRYGKLLQPIPREVQQKLWERARPMEPEQFAPKVLNAVARNKAIIIVPGWWRAFWWLTRFSPALGLYLGRKMYESLKKTLEQSSS